MQIKELRLNVQFEYIKEIRKYIYDIEEFLRENNLCDKLNQVPPVPDNVEPQIERLSSVKELENKTVKIFISQASITILFIYKASLGFEETVKKDIEYVAKISQDIKDLLSEKYSSFKINYEGLILASSKRILKDDKVSIEKFNINRSIVEERTKVVKDIDKKHTEMIEKSFLEYYNDVKPNINPMAKKTNLNTFVGWDYILVIEIDNRIEYNNSEDNDMSLPLDYDFAYTKIEEYFNKEIN